jgi:histone H3/H4
MQPKRTRSAVSKLDQRAIPRASFIRIVKAISNEMCLSKTPLKWSQTSIDGLHEEAEAYLEQHFSRANKLLNAFDQRTLHLRHFNNAGEVEPLPCSDTS